MHLGSTGTSQKNSSKLFKPFKKPNILESNFVQLSHFRFTKTESVKARKRSCKRHVIGGSGVSRKQKTGSSPTAFLLRHYEICCDWVKVIGLRDVCNHVTLASTQNAFGSQPFSLALLGASWKLHHAKGCCPRPMCVETL